MMGEDDARRRLIGAGQVEITEAFAQYILEARDAFKDLCEKVDRGLVLKGQSATVRITLTPAMVEELRAERLNVTANGASHG